MSVMNVKRATQTFAKSDQSGISKSDNVQSAGAGEFSKMFGDQSVGDIANKLTDPNWVDPTKKMRAVGNSELDKDAFLKLMLAQMKHQDPTNPMQSHEMASQLAQFTSLEQLNNINSTLESMKSSQAPNTNFQALAFIGKKVSGDSSKVTRGKGDTKHGFNFELLGDAAKVKVAVKDAGGNVVRNMEFANLKKGQNSIEWNGLQEDGQPARAGEYKFVIEGVGTNGAKVWAKTEFEGRITGLNYGAEGPVLMVGNQSIKLSDVKKIEEAGPMDFLPPTPLKAAKTMPSAAPAAAVTTATPEAKVSSQSQSQAAQAAAGEEVIPPAPEAEEAMTGNLADVPMSQGLLNALASSAGGPSDGTAGESAN